MDRKPDLIDRQKLLARMKKTNRYFDVKFDIESMPAVEAEPVVHAHWVGHLENDGYSAPGQWRCSRCGAMAGLNAIGNFAAISPFCGYCGAKMDEDTSHE